MLGAGVLAVHKKQMSDPKILAIILNWQQAEMTLACIQTLREMKYGNLDILVIDNGSADNSAQILQQKLPVDVNLHLMSDNLGFASGCNIGLHQAVADSYEYALLMNNDAFAAPDMLANLLAEANPDIALLSPKIYYESEPERIWFANGRQHPITLDLRDTGRGELDGSQWSDSRDVDYLLGTCLLVNLTAVRSVGFLDEQYFMYFEDLDWSIRLCQAGYRLRLVADAHLYHRVAVSSGGLESPIRQYYLACSSIIFWHCYAHIGNPIIIFFFRLGSGIKTIGRLLLRKKTAIAAAYLHGLRDGWRMATSRNKSV